VSVKKHILFVDDEPRILDGIRALLRRSRDRWEMRFAPGPIHALAEIEKQAFDVVVCDMRMPEMDGAEVLARVKAKQPAAARIVLSGHTEREAALRAVPVAHQFLPKPCHGGTLEMTIDRACGGAGLISDDRLRGVIGATFQLPSASRALQKLLSVIDLPSTGSGEVAGIIESDTAMCAKTLQIANSAFFSLPKRMTSVRQTVVYLGLDTVRAMALATGAFAILNGVPPALVDEIRRRGLLAAQIARIIAQVDPDDAFTAAMLQDIGQLLIAARLPEEHARIRTQAARHRVPIHLVEAEVLGATHAQVGAHLLSLWGLPAPIVQGVAFSDTPDVQGRIFDIAACTHVAGRLADEAEQPDSPIGVDASWLTTFGLQNHLPAWRTRARALAKQATVA
jgi:HD-like signal output (HDOD) protein/ActR/RegA family two-component response regulator